MKKAILFTAILLGSFILETSSAQTRVGLSINIGTQPVWGPVGYDHADYYYMPDIDVYYNVSRRQYIYMQQGRWRFAASLPARYHGYDLYTGYKVVINEPAPYRHDQTYRTKYAGFKGIHSQEAIRNSQDSKYFVNKNHPQHNQWKNDRNRGDNKNHGNAGNHGNDKHQQRGQRH